MGFVALSQVTLNATGNRWIIPQELYVPIRQDAVLLESGKANPAAVALIDFIKSEAGRKIIRKYGYASD